VLRELAMPEARFGVELVPTPAPDGLPCGAGGAEAPAFTLSANAGEKLRPLRQVASGGELSRAFLALKQALREGEAGMVLIFDEVDAGVGGEAADRVGRRLAELAAHHQVLCITHLPQIAAYASRHFRVRKEAGKRRTGVSIEHVEGETRVDELARMAGGDRAGEAARDYARELLATRSS
jgi:DNA repair protein RecN (Recombination protein N)